MLVTSKEVHAQGETATIQITGPTLSPGFFPDVLTVHVFDYVIFANQSSPATPYSITTDDGTFSSPPIAPGGQWGVTFTKPGAHEYHETASPPHMVGEIIVVASSVVLLPTAVPDIRATAIALVQAGTPLPDNLSLLTPTPMHVPNRLPVPGLTPTIGPWSITTILLIVESAVILLFLVIGSIFFIRASRRRSQKHDEGDPLVRIQKRWFPWPRKKKDEDEEDEDEEADD